MSSLPAFLAPGPFGYQAGAYQQASLEYPGPSAGFRPSSLPPPSVVPADDEADDAAPPVKKTRLVWTQDLHHIFEEAVEKLGPDKAVPKTIMQVRQAAHWVCAKTLIIFCFRVSSSSSSSSDGPLCVGGGGSFSPLTPVKGHYLVYLLSYSKIVVIIK